MLHQTEATEPCGPRRVKDTVLTLGPQNKSSTDGWENHQGLAQTTSPRTITGLRGQCALDGSLRKMEHLHDFLPVCYVPRRRRHGD